MCANLNKKLEYVRMHMRIDEHISEVWGHYQDSWVVRLECLCMMYTHIHEHIHVGIHTAISARSGDTVKIVSKPIPRDALISPCL
jgi:hypothetical protein